jgi:hypothetical protein
MRVRVGVVRVRVSVRVRVGDVNSRTMSPYCSPTIKIVGVRIQCFWLGLELGFRVTGFGLGFGF